MYGLKHLSLLSFLLLSTYANKSITHTTVCLRSNQRPSLDTDTYQVGIETPNGSRGIQAPLDDCYEDLDEE